MMSLKTQHNDNDNDDDNNDCDELKNKVVVIDDSVKTTAHHMTQRMPTERRLNCHKNLEENLNVTIGFSWWKKYVAVAFWSNISTPISFAITLMTALNTGQATTGVLLSDDLFVKLSIATLILTTINTFFKPNEQYNTCLNIMTNWAEYGLAFENIYFTVLDEEERFDAYVKLQQDVNKFENSLSSNNVNVLTDFIHIIAIKSCLKKRYKWIDTELGYVSDIETGYLNREQRRLSMMQFKHAEKRDLFNGVKHR